MLSIILIVIGLAIAGVLTVAAMRPDHFRIARSTRIEAPASKVFALINDFHHWPQWSPWERLDPAMKKIHSGASAGVGAIYAWEGNSKVGIGRSEITAAEPDRLVAIKLDFFKPFEAHNTSEFRIEAEGQACHVTWSMQGPQPFVARLMGLFFNMDKMVGGQFEEGLANLGAAARSTQ